MDVPNFPLVVEIKADDDDSEGTRAKERYGEEHFQALNPRLRRTNPIDFPEPFRESVNQQYIFYVLRPSDYPGWFGRLRTGMFIFNLGMDNDTNSK